MKNQNGFISLIFLLLLITISFFMHFLIISIINSDKEVINFASEIICLKRFQNNLKIHIKDIEKINRLISFAVELKRTIPSTPKTIVIIQSLNKLIYVLKTGQYGLTASYMKKNYFLKDKGCPLNILHTKSPFLNTLKIRRNSNQEAITKDKRWDYFFKLKKNRIIKINTQISKSNISFYSEIII